MGTEDREEGLTTPTAQDAPKPERRAMGRKPRAVAEHPEDRLAAERESQERDYSEDRELTDQERLEMFRDSRFQSVLPDLPLFPGYHVCWLTKTNPRDSLQSRLRQGYQLIRVNECKGWEEKGVRAGEVDNIVGVHEMVAAKIPLRLYNLYMREAHHDAPLEEEKKLVRHAQSVLAEAEELGVVLESGDGLEALKQRAPRAEIFTE